MECLIFNNNGFVFFDAMLNVHKTFFAIFELAKHVYRHV